ncbi:HIT family protein, partial [Streptococcus suis]
GVPQPHSRTALDMDEEAAATLLSVVPPIARQLKEKHRASGLNIVNNNEEDAGQTDFHTHIHLLPRFKNQDGLSIKF